MKSNIQLITERFFKEIFPKEEIKTNYRPDFLQYHTGHNLELDIYIPGKNLAIEVDSDYHLLPEQKERDRFKNKVCRDRNIQLLRIKNFEELLAKRDWLKTFKPTGIPSEDTMNAINNYDVVGANKAFARKLYILRKKEKQKKRAALYNFKTALEIKLARERRYARINGML